MRYYHCFIEKNEVLILDERSKIGYSYPRIFVMFETPRTITNRLEERIECDGIQLDVCLGTTLIMSRHDFNTWLDGEQIEIDNPEEVCKELNINYNGLINLINNFN